MRLKPQNLAMLVLGITLLFAYGCSPVAPAGPASTSAPNVSDPQKGHWSGEAVSFDVDGDGSISNFVLSGISTGGQQCDITADKVDLADDGSLTISSSYEYQGKTTTNKVTGKFETPDKVSGTALLYFCGLPDGGVWISEFAAPTDWTAKPDGS